MAESSVLRRATIAVASNWFFCWLLLTGIELLLGFFSVLISQSWGEDHEIWSDSSNWDAISAGITLLLATYLPVELAKHADCLSAFQKVAQKIKSLEQRRGTLGTSENNPAEEDFTNTTEELKTEVLKAHMDFPSIQNKLNAVYDLMKKDDEITMDRYVELEDSLVELKSKRDFDVPLMYQLVMLGVTLLYYGCILPGVRGKSPRGYYALLDVAFVGGINNLILAVAFRAASMFRVKSTSDFKTAEQIFQKVGKVPIQAKAYSKGYVYYPRHF